MFQNNYTTFCPLCEENGLKNKISKFDSCQYANTSFLFCDSKEVIIIKKIIINLMYPYILVPVPYFY